MWYVDKGSLFLRTPGPVLLGSCTCFTVKASMAELEHFQNLAFNLIRFPQSICDGCGMSTREAYSSGHLVPFHLALTYVLFVEAYTPKFVVIFLGFAYRTSHGTFSLSHQLQNNLQLKCSRSRRTWSVLMMARGQRP